VVRLSGRHWRPRRFPRNRCRSTFPPLRLGVETGSTDADRRHGRFYAHRLLARHRQNLPGQQPQPRDDERRLFGRLLGRRDHQTATSAQDHRVPPTTKTSSRRVRFRSYRQRGCGCAGPRPVVDLDRADQTIDRLLGGSLLACCRTRFAPALHGLERVPTSGSQPTLESTGAGADRRLGGRFA